LPEYHGIRYTCIGTALGTIVDVNATYTTSIMGKAQVKSTLLILVVSWRC